MDTFLNKIIASSDRTKRIVFPETEDERILRAASEISQKRIAIPVLLGNPGKIISRMKKLNLQTEKVVFTDPSHPRPDYRERLNQLLGEKLSSQELDALFSKRLYYGALMVEQGDADGIVAGATHSTSETLKAGLRVLGTKKGVKTASSFFIMVLKNRILFFSDCAFNIDPTSEQLSEIALSTSTSAKLFGFKPRIAFLSFSTRGSAKHARVDKVVQAFKIFKSNHPDIICDGELQVDAAIVPEVCKIKCKDSKLKGEANILIFPDLDSGNIAYKITERLGGAVAIGPITQGFAKPINDLSRGCSVEDIVLVAAITSIQASKKI